MGEEPTIRKMEVFSARIFVQDLLSGGVAAAVAKTAVAPLERVKLLLQVQHTSPHIAPHAKYTGILNCFIRVSNEQGAVSLWRGNFANVIRYFPTQALNFAIKDEYKRMFLRNTNRQRDGFAKWFGANLLAGGCAGVTALTVVYPLDFARTRLAADVGGSSGVAAREFTGIANCLAKTVRSDGVVGVYRGFVASVQCIFVYRAAYFGLFDSFKDTGKDGSQKRHDEVFEFMRRWGVAQFAATSSASFAYPLDTIRRRMMMQAGRTQDSILYRSTLQCWRRTLHEEGIRGVYHGFVANLFRTIGGALVLTIYDEIQRRLSLEVVTS